MLDQTLLYQTRRKPRADGLTPEERIALNVLWRGYPSRSQRVKVPILVKVFGISKNTIYYKALTGGADSYPNTDVYNPAAETNAVIDKMGIEAAYKKFVTPEMVKAINEEMKRELEHRDDDA
jgi:hypothetical protein